ncbi:molybdate transport repressor ModE-like protein [Catenulispora sp. GP43]|uniref:LysR family transcriptional regulator n=1 Tax=Catenulispora sp. GP43 TaxID=3156263 RepID=UPI003517E677
MDIDPRRLLILQAVAEAGSLAGAARILGHTPSAVSQQLNRLEQEAGTALAERGAGRRGQVELTAAGLVLARAGEALASTLAEAERQLAAVTGRARGPVTIGAVPGKVVTLAAETVALLARTRPELEPAVRETESGPGLADLRLGALDVLILTDDRTTAVALPPGCAARVIIEAEYRIAVPDDWEPPATAAELSGRPWIAAIPDSARGRCFARFAAEHGVVPSVEHLARNPYSVQALARARLGAVLVPRYLADALDNVIITDLPVTGSYLVRALYRTTPAAEAAVEAVQQAALRRAEHEVATGEYPREIAVKRLVDPSEQIPG